MACYEKQIEIFPVHASWRYSGSLNHYVCWRVVLLGEFMCGCACSLGSSVVTVSASSAHIIFNQKVQMTCSGYFPVWVVKSYLWGIPEGILSAECTGYSE